MRPLSGEPDRSRPVPPAPAQPFAWPRLQEGALANGLKLALMEMRRLPLVSLQIVLPYAGTCAEPQGKAGLAGLLA